MAGEFKDWAIVKCNYVCIFKKKKKKKNSFVPPKSPYSMESERGESIELDQLKF